MDLPVKNSETNEPKLVALHGVVIVPHNSSVGGTPVGGLSGIDRDPQSGRYVTISDDQSQQAPARFYEAEIDLDDDGLQDVLFTGVHLFRRPDAKTYPSRTEWLNEQTRYRQTDRNLLGTVDPEDIRVDPHTGGVIWTSEGLNLTNADGGPMVPQPTLRVSARDGRFLRDLPTPVVNLIGKRSGPRRNRSLEGLTFAAGGRLIASVMEGPLAQDGTESTRTDGSLTRITVQDRDGRLLAQYAYPIDSLPDVTPEGPYGALIGVSAILAFEPESATRFVLMERAFVSGYGRRIRIYEADCTDATDVTFVASLMNEPFKTVRKTLLADLADIGLPNPDNFEGITGGPVSAQSDQRRANAPVGQ